MKSLVHSTLLFSSLIGASVLSAATVPSLDVTVMNPAGKVAYKGRTNASGVFQTAKMEPGSYVVQFNTKSAAEVKKEHFALVVSAGKQKVSAEDVEGAKLAGAGVAMKLEVKAASAISGQVADAVAANDPNVKIINGKRYVWVGPELGSHLGGRWVLASEANGASARRVGTMRKEGVQAIQDKTTGSSGN